MGWDGEAARRPDLRDPEASCRARPARCSHDEVAPLSRARFMDQPWRAEGAPAAEIALLQQITRRPRSGCIARDADAFNPSDDRKIIVRHAQRLLVRNEVVTIYPVLRVDSIC